MRLIEGGVALVCLPVNLLQALSSWEFESRQTLGLQSMELQRVGHDWACAHTLQSETRTGVPAAPLSGLSPCVIQCPGVSSMNYFLHWTTAAPMWTCSAGHYKLRAQGEASKTPALPRVSKTQVQRNPVLMTSGMEG